MPWEPDYKVAANNVRVGFSEWLRERLTAERGVHIETLLVVSGAMVGFAAHCAAVDRRLDQGKGSLARIGTSDGRQWIMGDGLNCFLVPEDPEITPAWNFISAAVLRAGGTPAQLPKLDPLFEHVTGKLGHPDYGQVRMPPGSGVGMTALQAYIFWPQALQLLQRPGIGDMKDTALPSRYWPAVMAAVAQNHMDMGKDVFPVAEAARVVMEAAIFASKIDQIWLRDSSRPLKPAG